MDDWFHVEDDDIATLFLSLVGLGRNFIAFQFFFFFVVFMVIGILCSPSLTLPYGVLLGGSAPAAMALFVAPMIFCLLRGRSSYSVLPPVARRWYFRRAKYKMNVLSRHDGGS